MKKADHPFLIKESLAVIKGFNRLRQEGNDFLFGQRQDKIKLTVDRHKFRTLLLLVIICFTVILGRAVWLQVIQGKNYNLIAEGNRIRLEKMPAERGIIFDRFNKALVTNVADYALYFVPADLPAGEQEQSDIATKLASIININAHDLLKIFRQPARSFERHLITDNLTHQQAVRLSVLENDLAGISLVAHTRRQYLDNSGLSHILGYVGKINKEELERLAERGYDINSYLGKNGIELTYEDTLHGLNGIREIEVDALGKTKKILNKLEPQIGSSLVLTIDLDLQKKLTSSLIAALNRTPGTNRAAAIALQPDSGEILAMVSLPSFDNNFFSAGIGRSAYEDYLNHPDKPLFNRAVSGTYPPGSIFKPIVALAALEEGIINESKTFLSTGGLQVNHWFFPDWKYGGHGRVNVVTAIAQSVNTFFYYIGGGYNDFTGLGVKKITTFAKKFNLSKPLGIDLPGEAAGFLPSKSWKKAYKNENWYIGDTYHLAIGQGDILVTPLQVAAYTAVFANQGTLYKPHLLKEVITHNGPQRKTNFLPETYIINHDFVSSKNIQIIRQGLRATVTRGSARSLQSLPVAAAGKTGTAQVGGQQKPHAWFTGFAPYQSPSIVLTILIENGGEGSSVAVPVFKEVMEWYFSEN